MICAETVTNDAKGFARLSNPPPSRVQWETWARDGWNPEPNSASNSKADTTIVLFSLLTLLVVGGGHPQQAGRLLHNRQGTGPVLCRRPAGKPCGVAIRGGVAEGGPPAARCAGTGHQRGCATSTSPRAARRWWSPVCRNVLPQRCPDPCFFFSDFWGALAIFISGNLVQNQKKSFTICVCCRVDWVQMDQSWPRGPQNPHINLIQKISNVKAEKPPLFRLPPPPTENTPLAGPHRASLPWRRCIIFL